MAIYDGDKQIHELYNGDTYLEELYDGDTKIFDAGWDTEVSGTSPLTLSNARAKQTSWKIDGQSRQNNLPDGYTELEYLQSNGTQYIDTGKTLDTSTDTLEVKYENTGGTAPFKWAFGSYRAGGSSIGITTGSGTTSSNMYYSSVQNIDSSYFTGSHTLLADNNGVSMDGTNIVSYVNFTTSSNLYLFATNNYGAASNNGNYKIYSYKQTRNGSDIINLIPAKNSDNVYGLYDLVSNTFFTNSGTGTFTAGPEATPTPTNPVDVNSCGNSDLPNGYKKLEYIQSTGTQRIDLNISGNARAIIDAQCESDAHVLLSSTAAANAGTWIGGYSNKDYWTVGSSIFFTIPKTTRSVIDATFSSSGVTATIGSETKTNTQTITQGDWTLFACGSMGLTFTGKVWSCKMYQNDALVRNLIPVRRYSDSAIGMVDTVTNTFFTNAGTGDFIAGPEDTSCVVPILQANNCGSYTFTGNETAQILLHNWRPTDTTYAIGFRYSLFGDGINYSDMSGVGPAYCNSDDLPLSTYSNLYNGSVSPVYCYYTGTDNTYSLFVRLPKTIANSDADVLNWLKGKTIYYQRTTDTTWNIPTITNITLPAPLQKIGTYKDTIESDGTLTRGVGIKVLDGTNLVVTATGWATGVACRHSDLGALAYAEGGTANTFKCSHLTVIGGSDADDTLNITSSPYGIRFNFDTTIIPPGTAASDRVAVVNAWLAAQYAAGTPVTIYYPFATETETTVQVPVLSTSKGTNYISAETNIKPSNMEFTYRKRTKE